MRNTGFASRTAGCSTTPPDSSPWRGNMPRQSWRKANPEKTRQLYHRQARTPKGMFHTLKISARRRNIEVTISLEQFRAIRWGASCVYCSGPLPVAGSGIDRKDNTKGYVEGNCIPCCKVCNKIKGPYLSFDDMMFLAAYRRKDFAALKARIAELEAQLAAV